MEASRTVTRGEGRSVVAPDQDLWSPRRPPLGKVQTGGAGSAPTMQRAADHQVGALGARPGWWGCAFRGRVRARPAPPHHVKTEEGSACTAAVAPDLAWNTNHRRSNQRPSALPHHDGSRPRACAAPTPARWSEQAPAASTPCGPDGSDTLRLWLGAPGGWTTAGGVPGRYARPSPPCVRGGRYALPKPAGVGVSINAHRLCLGSQDRARFTPYGIGRAWVGSTFGPLAAPTALCRGHSSRLKGWAGIASLDPAPDDTPTTSDVRPTCSTENLPPADCAGARSTLRWPPAPSG
ncbi:hypothetical protein SAMN05421803_1164 [Nocardiopsis flavescens]|uniref:Uncharacterized protein n=1 Tax=Nocardiopsis flavescens TaxID=758803 RepID=A0A1M6QST7_9ACTN|nr:hypothetical protein SAMN05421803_1164 [Nocardiopsis flavescens]